MSIFGLVSVVNGKMGILLKRELDEAYHGGLWKVVLFSMCTISLRSDRWSTSIFLKLTDGWTDGHMEAGLAPLPTYSLNYVHMQINYIYVYFDKYDSIYFMLYLQDKIIY